MHLEFLVEDKSGEVALTLLLPRLLGSEDTFKVLPYKGIGRLPKGMKANGLAENRILLDQLPRILQGYGRTFEGYGPTYKAAVVVVCDLDDKDLREFLTQLNSVLRGCDPPPTAAFCIAIEEGEAWFLGDRDAVRNAFPQAHEPTLTGYSYDSICGSWETLADVIHPGGAAALKKLGWQETGRMKSEWARAIAPLMEVSMNQSPSFQHFVKTVGSLMEE